MPEVRLLSIGRAVPDARYSQQELLAHSPWGDLPLLERLFDGSTVATRGLYVPPAYYAQARALSETNQQWCDGAVSLGTAALGEALSACGRSAADVDMLGVTTVTGYTTPGLDVKLAKAMDLSTRLQRVHFNCIGCHAALPLLRAAADHAAQRPGSMAVAAAIEVCSACFVADDDPQNLVALSLFGDGAAAATLSTDGDGPVVVDFETQFDFEAADALAFGLTTEGFRIVLDPSVPDRIARAVASTADRLLQRHGLARRDVGLWCVHPGGARILDATEAALELPADALRFSRRVLRSYGNMSSPSILFVLAEALDQAPPPQGTPIVALAFGPGLGIEAALLRA